MICTEVIISGGDQGRVELAVFAFFFFLENELNENRERKKATNRDIKDMEM